MPQRTTGAPAHQHAKHPTLRKNVQRGCPCSVDTANHHQEKRRPRSQKWRGRPQIEALCNAPRSRRPCSQWTSRRDSDTSVAAFGMKREAVSCVLALELVPPVRPDPPAGGLNASVLVADVVWPRHGRSRQLLPGVLLSCDAEMIDGGYSMVPSAPLASRGEQLSLQTCRN